MQIIGKTNYLFSEQEGSAIERNLKENTSKTARAIFLSPSYFHKMLKGKMPINPEQLKRLYDNTNKSPDLDFIPPLLRLAELLGKTRETYGNSPEKRDTILGDLEKITQSQ